MIEYDTNEHNIILISYIKKAYPKTVSEINFVA